MSDSSQILEGLQIFLQRATAPLVHNILWQIMPTADFLFGLSGDQTKGGEGLGRPDSGLYTYGRINGASRPRMERLKAAREYLPLVQISKPSKTDVKKMSDYDSNPEVPNWDTTNRVLHRFVQPRFKLSRTKMPCKVAKSELRTAVPSGGSNQGQAAAAIKDVFMVETKSRMASLVEQLNDELFGINSESGAPADEDAVTWDSIHSIANAIKADNVYGGIDRSVAGNEWWKGNRYNTSWTGTLEDLLNHANYKMFADISQHGSTGGLKSKGLGGTLAIVGGDLIIRAKREAKASFMAQAPQVAKAEMGLQRDIVTIYAGGKPVTVVYDPAMDAVDAAAGTKHLYLLDPSTWTMAIPADRNFKVLPVLDLEKTSEGGDEAFAYRIETELLLCCEVPAANAIYTNIAV